MSPLNKTFAAPSHDEMTMPPSQHPDAATGTEADGRPDRSGSLRQSEWGTDLCEVWTRYCTHTNLYSISAVAAGGSRGSYCNKIRNLADTLGLTFTGR